MASTLEKIDVQLLAAAGATHEFDLTQYCRDQRLVLAAARIADGGPAPLHILLDTTTGAPTAAVTDVLVCTGGKPYEFSPGTEHHVLQRYLKVMSTVINTRVSLARRQH